MSPAKKSIKKRPSATPRVNKDAKPAEVLASVVPEEYYKCSCCGHKYPRQKDNFNVSKSPIYKGNNGYTTICKKCIGDLFAMYVKFFDNDELAAADRICQMVDMYFDDNAWDASRKISADRNRMSTYVSKLNLCQSTRGQTYSDTLVKRYEDQVENAKSAAEAEENKNITVEQETIRRFGLGFKDGEYDSLQYEYDTWTERYGEPVDKRQEELYVTMCYLKLNLQRGIQGDSNGIGALANSYKAFIEAATTEIEDRQKKMEAEIELKPLGVLARDIEEFCPAEIYRDKKLYADFDSLIDYFMRILKRPLQNLLTGSKDMDKEYNLSSSEE